MKTMARKVCLSMILCLSVFVSTVYAASGTLTYSSSEGNDYFGPWVMHEPGWDRYLMFVSMNSTVAKGKPSKGNGDANTYNSACKTYFADRIWVTWHFGNGLTPSEWGGADSYGTTGPLLLLSPGGPGEDALIGDPSVVYWQGKWHMFYEGTSRCDGNDNRIFHATADNWSGPWTKQGEVWGLYGDLTGSGLSWPTVMVDNGQLHLYFTDGSVRLMAATALDSTGHHFLMENYDQTQPLGMSNPAPVIGSLVNRATVVKTDNGYKMVYDNFGRTEVRVTESTNKFNFASGIQVLTTEAGTWQTKHVGLPQLLKDGTSERIYYTGTYTAGGTSPDDVSSIGYYLLN